MATKTAPTQATPQDFVADGQDDGATRNFHPSPGEGERSTTPTTGDTAPGTYVAGPSVPVAADPATGRPLRPGSTVAPDGTVTESPEEN